MDQNQNVRLEGKSSPWKWLLPLLILLVILGILYALLKSDTNNTNYEQDTSPSTESTSTPESQETLPVTSIADIYMVTDVNALNGLQVDIKNAPVQRVTGSSTFFIGNKASTTQQVLVYAPNHDRVKIGDTRDITGTIKPLPSVQELQSTWKVTANELNALKNVKVYIDATSVATSSSAQ